MIEANRIKELADRLRSDQARQNGISQREMESCADLLDELARIKSAVLPETVSSIEKRHAKVLAALGPSGPEYRDIGTLLDALRAKEAEQEEARLRYNKRASHLIQKVNDVTGERDEARTQLDQAQTEIARLTAIRDARVQDLTRADERERLQRFEIESLKADAEDSRQLRDIAIKSLTARTQELDRAESDKAALPSRPLRAVIAEALSARGWWLDPDPQCKGDLRYQPNKTYSMQIHDAVKWQIYCVEERVSSCPCPKCLRCCCAQIPELAGRDCVNAAHGVCDCARRDIEPDKGRYLLPPGRWLVGERTVKLDASEYVCKGSWALGTACGTCRKCLETKAEQTDKERG